MSMRINKAHAMGFKIRWVIEIALTNNQRIFLPKVRLHNRIVSNCGRLAESDSVIELCVSEAGIMLSRYLLRYF